jgi:TfoX/Sxy family transcriptional regulator of competence genes
MPYDEGLAQVIREALAERPGITEKKMFGGLCFLMNGNMLCGVYREGGMYRVGEEQADAALALPHVRPMAMTGRAMPGLVDVDAETFTDAVLRDRLMGMARAFVGALPPKETIPTNGRLVLRTRSA